MVRGIRLSTSAVAGAVVLQVTIMVIACVLILVDHRGDLTGAPFHWSAVTGGIGGLSAGFPLALYMFIGWENGPALAEECRDPRTTVPRALMASIAIATVLFLLFAYATVTGFGYDVSSIGRSSIPFLTVADRALGPFAVVAWVAGIVSVLATLVSGSNSQSRMLYDAGRTGKLPRWLGVIRPSSRTPARALGAFVGIGLAVIGGWALAHVVGVGTGSMDPVGLYAECSTLGTIVILFVYVLTMASLPGLRLEAAPRTILRGPPHRAAVVGRGGSRHPVRDPVHAGPARRPTTCSPSSPWPSWWSPSRRGGWSCAGAASVRA